MRGILSALAIAACIATTPDVTAQQGLRAEMLVKALPGPQFACVSEEALDRVILHSVRGEKSKFAAMFQDSTCVRMPEGKTYRLLSVKLTTVEFTHESKLSASRGMWTDVSTFVPIAPVRRCFGQSFPILASPGASTITPVWMTQCGVEAMRTVGRSGEHCAGARATEAYGTKKPTH